MIDFIEKICRECGPRLAGSDGEKRAGEIIFKEMLSFCDEVEKEFYKSHPRGFLDYIWVVAILYIAATVFYFLNYPIISAILIITALLIFLFQQCLHYEIIDFLFPEVEEFHVVGKIKPKEEAKKLVIISAHYDSAYEFPLLGRLRNRSVFIVGLAIIIAILTMLLSLIEALFGLSLTFLLSLMIFESFLILFLAFTLRSNFVTLGANDDLAGVAVILEAGKEVSLERPRNTEVWVVAFAGEEHMRGSKRFVQRHYKELKKRDAIMLALECPSGDYFLIATNEKMFFAKHSKVAIEYAKKAAKNIDFDIRVGPLPFAGSDAANFSRKGLHAVSVFGLSAKDDVPYYWHTKDDVPEKIKQKSLEKAKEFVKNFVYVIDSNFK